MTRSLLLVLALLVGCSAPQRAPDVASDLPRYQVGALYAGGINMGTIGPKVVSILDGLGITTGGVYTSPAEADTLDTVTDRGATTSNAVTFLGGFTAGQVVAGTVRSPAAVDDGSAATQLQLIGGLSNTSAAGDVLVRGGESIGAANHGSINFDVVDSPATISIETNKWVWDHNGNCVVNVNGGGLGIESATIDISENGVIAFSSGPLGSQDAGMYPESGGIELWGGDLDLTGDVLLRGPLTVYEVHAAGDSLGKGESGSVHSNSTGATLVLPTVAVAGITLTFVAQVDDLIIDVGASEKFVGFTAGTVDGEHIECDTGDAFQVVSQADGDWCVTWTRGTPVEETP